MSEVFEEHQRKTYDMKLRIFAAFIACLVFALYCSADTGVPEFTLDGPSGWRLQDGAITFEITPETDSANLTNTTCSVDYGDTTKETGVVWKENLTLTHSFPSTGTFNTFIVCSNHNTSFATFHIVEIVPGDVKIQQLVANIPSYILVDTSAEIKISIQEGTEVLYKITVGAAIPVWVHTMGHVKSKTLIYRFSEVGTITTVVTATNDVSYKQTRPKSEVLYPVKGFVLKSSHSIASVNQIVEFKVQSPGSKNFPMGPLLVEVFNNLTSITSKTLLEAEADNVIKVHETNLSRGEHVIMARISSPVHQQEVSVKLTIIDLINTFNVTDVTFETDKVISMNTSQSSVNATIDVAIDGVVVNQPPPLGVCISWMFDGRSDIEEEHLASWTKTYAYKRRGQYDVKISVELTGHTTIATYSLPIRVGFILAEIQPTQGNAKETTFALRISGVFGSDVKYWIDFGDGNAVVFYKADVSESNVTTVKKVFDTAGMYTIRVIVSSEVHSEEIVLDEMLSVLWPIKAYAVTWKQERKKPPVLVRFYLNFTEPFPSNLSCSVHFGEVNSSVVVEFDSTPDEAISTETPVEQTTFLSTGDVTGTANEDTAVTMDQSAVTMETTENQTGNQTVYVTEEKTTTAMETTKPVSVVPVLRHQEIRVDYNYSRAGQFSLTISCHNAVSNVTKSQQITVHASAVSEIPLVFLLFILSTMTVAFNTL